MTRDFLNNKIHQFILNKMIVVIGCSIKPQVCLMKKTLKKVAELDKRNKVLLRAIKNPEAETPEF